MKKDIFIFKSGEIKRKENTIFFQNDEVKKFLPVTEIDNLYVFGEVNINKKALDFISQNSVCIHFYNYYGYYSGTFYPREHLNSGFVILKQSEYYLNYQKRMYISYKIISSAITNIVNNLKYYKKKTPELEEIIDKIEEEKDKLEETENINEIMAIEGNVRNEYYKTFNKIINKKEFHFEKRTRMPPKDKINALISFGNTLMYNTVLSQIYKTNLDPRIGYLHSTNDRRFTLNLDVAEIFKPIIVDRTIFTLLNKNILKEEHFMKELNGILLNEKGMQKFLEMYNEKLLTVIKHPKLKREITYKTLIKMELYKIQKHITKDEELNCFEGAW
jgi:CRISPR-associated protein Cas1